MDYEKLWRQAKAYAAKRNFEQIADDFAQEAVSIASTTGKIRLDWAFVDYLRKTYGDTRTPVGRKKSFGMLGAVSLDAPSDKEKENSASLHSLIGSSEQCPGRKFIDNRVSEFIDLFDERSKLILLGTLEGKCNNQIAKEAGVTPPRITQQADRLRDVLLIMQLVPDKLKAWVIRNVI